jgi:hypothetical protein
LSYLLPVLLNTFSISKQMYDILFSQLCLRVPPATASSFGDDVQHDRNLNLTSVNKKSDIDNMSSNKIFSTGLNERKNLIENLATL